MLNFNNVYWLSAHDLSEDLRKSCYSQDFPIEIDCRWPSSDRETIDRRSSPFRSPVKPLALHQQGKIADLHIVLDHRAIQNHRIAADGYSRADLYCRHLHDAILEQVGLNGAILVEGDIVAEPH